VGADRIKETSGRAASGHETAWRTPVWSHSGGFGGRGDGFTHRGREWGLEGGSRGGFRGGEGRRDRGRIIL